MNLRWVFEDNAPKFMCALTILSAIAGAVTTAGMLIGPFETVLSEIIADVFGIHVDVASGHFAEISPMILVIAVAYLLWTARRSENRREGIAQLADACCIHTLRLVTLVQELRRRPERANNALDVAGLRGMPVESATFSFRIANVNTRKDEVVHGLLTDDSLDSGGVDFEVGKKLISSDVEYNFEFKLAWYAKFWNKISLVTWLFGDNGKCPEHFRYYYARRSKENERSAAPMPYKNSSFSYSPNEGLYVVSHSVRPSLVGPDRIFGMCYQKLGCLGWDFDDDFTIYPTAIAGDVRKAAFRIELQKEIYDILNSSGGISFELHEVVCSGDDPGKGGRPAHFDYAGPLKTVSRREDGTKLPKTDPDRLFRSGREFVLFETPEIKIDPDNVYIVLVKPNAQALDELRSQADSFGGEASGEEGVSNVAVPSTTARSAGSSSSPSDLSFVLADVSDAPQIAQLMLTAQGDCPCKDFYVASSLERVEWKLRTNSFAYLAKDGDRVAAFYIVEMPGHDCEENLGCELPLSDDELRRVACMDSVAVDSGYRGRGLQRRLASLCEAEALRRGYDIFLATVDPRNTPSLRNFIADGYDVTLVREGFYVEGVPRALLMKRADGKKLQFTSLTGGTVCNRCGD